MIRNDSAMSKAEEKPDDGWSSQVYALIKDAGIALVTTVPDAGLTRLLGLCNVDRDIRVATLLHRYGGDHLTNNGGDHHRLHPVRVSFRDRHQ